MVSAVELPDLAQRPVRDEVDGVLAIADRESDGEPAPRVGRVQGDQVAAAVGLDRPARVELAVVARRPEQRRAEKGRVGDEQAPLGPHARAGREPVAQAQLLHPQPVPPHPRPRPCGLRVTIARGTDALHPELQRAAERVGTERRRVGPAPERLVAGSEKRIVQHEAIPARAFQPERPLGLETARPLQKRLAPRLAPQPPADRELLRVHEGDGQLSPVHQDARVEQRAQPSGADVQLIVLEETIAWLGPHRSGAQAHRVAAHVDQQAQAARVQRRVEAAVERQAVAGFAELQRGGRGHQRFGPDAVRRHCATGGPPDLELDEHRFRRGVRRLGVRVERRRPLADAASRDCGEREQQRAGPNLTSHGRRTWRESRTGGTRSTTAGSRSSRSVTSSYRSQ